MRRKHQYWSHISLYLHFAMSGKVISPPKGLDASTVGPAFPNEARLGLTVAFTTIYALVFVMIFVQLFLILYYKHRQLSWQSVFLFVCLLWSAIRTTLFSFYFNDCIRVNKLSMLPRWFLFAFPVYLQFLTLSLLSVFFGKVVLKSRRTSLEPNKYKRHLYWFVGALNLVFFTMNITSAFLCPEQSTTKKVVVARVVVNELLFFVVGVLLCFCIWKITRVPSANLFIEGEGVTTCKSLVVCILVVLLYLSRAAYNIIAVTVPHVSSFGYGWINISDQGEIKYDKDSYHSHPERWEYLSFGVVLIIWEVLPTVMAVWFFRVRKPQTGSLGPSAIASQSYDKKSFFNNPRRYDSEEDLTVGQNPRQSNFDIPGVLSPSSSLSVNAGRSYGSISGARSNNSLHKSNSYSNPYITGTSPPLFSGSQGYHQGALVAQQQEK